MDAGRGRAGVVAVALGVGLLTGCGDDAPQVRLPADPPPGAATSTPAPSTPPPATSTAPAAPTSPSTTTTTASPTASSTATSTATATATSGPAGGTADLDGDGQLDRVAVTGATLTARLTSGAVESVALPDDTVAADVEVLGRSDLDGDGTDEALVRTQMLPSGDVRVVLRLGGSGLELLATESGRPFELGFLVGMTGRRSYECREVDPTAGREVRVLDVERVGDPGPDLTFTGTVTTWSVAGARASVLGTEPVEDVDGESRQAELDSSTCRP